MINRIKYYKSKGVKFSFYTFLLSCVLILFTGCQEHLNELSKNPNGIDPSAVNPNLVMTTVLTEAAKKVVENGFGDLSGAMQHTQKAGWGASHSKYYWSPKDWDNYYHILMNNEITYRRAVEMDYEFHQGVCLVMKSFLFGMLTDFWGDAPYSDALKGEESDKDLNFPAFDSQESIYKGIISDLEKAASLLSGEQHTYEGINKEADVLFHGDPEKWMKFANSLTLRYYMRLSEKLPSFAEAGILKMLDCPLISNVEEEVSLKYIADGNPENSWPTNTEFDRTGSIFNRHKPCATLVNKLLELKDPRIHVWFSPVKIPTRLVSSPDISNRYWGVLIDGVRYLNKDSLIIDDRHKIKVFDTETYKQNVLDGFGLIDTNSVYVGLPSSVSPGDGSFYNLNFIGTMWNNPHVSLLNDIFKEPEGELLKARVLSYAEVCFLKAEAALKGWSGNAEENYYAGIKASLEAWGIEEKYDSYILNDGVVFNGTLEQIIEQKWIASFTAASESWFDWRRTGRPKLQTGPYPKRDRIPLRFYYGEMEKDFNQTNYKSALSGLVETNYSYQDGPDSAWSKMWLLQDTGKPW